MPRLSTFLRLPNDDRDLAIAALLLAGAFALMAVRIIVVDVGATAIDSERAAACALRAPAVCNE